MRNNPSTRNDRPPHRRLVVGYRHDVDNETPQAPRAHDKIYDAVEDTPLNIDAANGILAGAWDPNWQSLWVGMNSGPSNGTVTFDTGSGAFTYTPNADGRADSFIVNITDDGYQTTTITVTLNVDSINDAPTVMHNLGLTLGQGAAEVITRALLLSEDDADAQESLTSAPPAPPGIEVVARPAARLSRNRYRPDGPYARRSPRASRQRVLPTWTGRTTGFVVAIVPQNRPS